MIYRSKAPLRLGLAGGGTDVSPYCDLYGGCILNATISMFAYATIETNLSGNIILQSYDLNKTEKFLYTENIPLNNQLDLLKGVYNRIQKDFSLQLKGITISTFVDAPAGSGLGTSSTLVVAILGAFVEMLHLPLTEYDIAQLAYSIERNDLKLAGGRQDQYAATFGGVNFIEFFADEKIIVNPLRIKKEYLFELENNLVLYYTQTTRQSAIIINIQSKNVIDKNQQSIEAMHQLKHQTFLMKEALLKGRVNDVGPILDFGFKHKKLMAEGISTSSMDEVYEIACKAGATGGKISGAGGGGFMIFYCPGNSKYKVIDALKKLGGTLQPYQFMPYGLKTWTVKD